MAADQHIHIFEGITLKDLELFFCTTMGSKWFDPERSGEKQQTRVYDKIAATPQVHVGEVSWLKAGLFEDPETFVPDTVMRISELIPSGEEPTLITTDLISEVEKALQLPNKTSYHLSPGDEILVFLRQHLGKKAFTVSW